MSGTFSKFLRTFGMLLALLFVTVPARAIHPAISVTGQTLAYGLPPGLLVWYFGNQFWNGAWYYGQQAWNGAREYLDYYAYTYAPPLSDEDFISDSSSAWNGVPYGPENKPDNWHEPSTDSSYTTPETSGFDPSDVEQPPASYQSPLSTGAEFDLQPVTIQSKDGEKKVFLLVPARKVLTNAEKKLLASTRDLHRASGQLTFNQMSDWRQLMSAYRTGQPFQYGLASIDDIPASELQASIASERTQSTDFKLDKQWHSFIQLSGLEGHYKEGTEFSAMDGRGYGLNIGLFRQASKTTTLGIMAGSRKTSVHYKYPASGQLETFHFGPFLSWSHHHWHLNAALTLGINQYSGDRKTLTGRALRHNYSGQEWSAYGALGYDFDLNHWTRGLTLTPMVEVLYIQANHSGFTEKGQSVRALQVGSKTYRQTITRFGSELTYLLPDLENPTTIKALFGWQQQQLKGVTADYSFVGQENKEHLGIPGIKDQGLFFGLGLHRQMSDLSRLGVHYSATQSGKSTSQGLQFQYDRSF